MADNVPITPGSGAIVATDDVGGVQYQKVKVDIGGDGASVPLVPGQATMAASISVAIASNQTTLPTNQVTAATDIKATVTRPANTTAYAAGDVVGATAAAISFPAIGPSAATIMITGVELEMDEAALPSGAGAFRLHLYNVTPPSALADNAAFDLPSGDRNAYLGFVDISTPEDFGATLYAAAFNINKQLKLSGTGVWGYLVTTGAYTPTSASVARITLHAQAV